MIPMLELLHHTLNPSPICQPVEGGDPTNLTLGPPECIKCHRKPVYYHSSRGIRGTEGMESIAGSIIHAFLDPHYLAVDARRHGPKGIDITRQDDGEGQVFANCRFIRPEYAVGYDLFRSFTVHIFKVQEKRDVGYMHTKQLGLWVDSEAVPKMVSSCVHRSMWKALKV